MGICSFLFSGFLCLGEMGGLRWGSKQNREKSKQRWSEGVIEWEKIII